MDTHAHAQGDAFNPPVRGNGPPRFTHASNRILRSREDDKDGIHLSIDVVIDSDVKAMQTVKLVLQHRGGTEVTSLYAQEK